MWPTPSRDAAEEGVGLLEGPRQVALKARKSVFNLLRKVEQNLVSMDGVDFSAEDHSAVALVLEQHALMAKRGLVLSCFLHWRGRAFQLKVGRRSTRAVAQAHNLYVARIVFREWFALAVVQTRAMLKAYERLQRKERSSPAFIAATHGAYAKLWAKAVLIAWKRFVLDTPGGYLLHRRSRLERGRHDFKSALVKATLLGEDEGPDTEQRGTQCDLMEEGRRANQGASTAGLSPEEVCALLTEKLEQREQELVRERQRLADATSHIGRLECLASMNVYSKKEIGDMVNELKGMRTTVSSFPMTFDKPLTAIVRSRQCYEISKMNEVRDIVSSLSHSIAACSLEETKLVVNEFDLTQEPLVIFHSQSVANLCIVAGLITQFLEQRESFGGLSLKMYHEQVLPVSKGVQVADEEEDFTLDHVKALGRIFPAEDGDTPKPVAAGLDVTLPLSGAGTHEALPRSGQAETATPSPAQRRRKPMGLDRSLPGPESSEESPSPPKCKDFDDDKALQQIAMMMVEGAGDLESEAPGVQEWQSGGTTEERVVNKPTKRSSTFLRTRGDTIYQNAPGDVVPEAYAKSRPSGSSAGSRRRRSIKATIVESDEAEDLERIIEEI